MSITEMLLLDCGLFGVNVVISLYTLSKCKSSLVELDVLVEMQGSTSFWKLLPSINKCCYNDSQGGLIQRNIHFAREYVTRL